MFIKFLFLFFSFELVRSCSLDASSLLDRDVNIECCAPYHGSFTEEIVRDGIRRNQCAVSLLTLKISPLDFLQASHERDKKMQGYTCSSENKRKDTLFEDNYFFVDQYVSVLVFGDSLGHSTQHEYYEDRDLADDTIQSPLEYKHDMEAISSGDYCDLPPLHNLDYVRDDPIQAYAIMLFSKLEELKEEKRSTGKKEEKVEENNVKMQEKLRKLAVLYEQEGKLVLMRTEIDRRLSSLAEEERSINSLHESIRRESSSMVERISLIEEKVRQSDVMNEEMRRKLDLIKESTGLLRRGGEKSYRETSYMGVRGSHIESVDNIDFFESAEAFIEDEIAVNLVKKLGSRFSCAREEIEKQYILLEKEQTAFNLEKEKIRELAEQLFLIDQENQEKSTLMSEKAGRQLVSSPGQKTLSLPRDATDGVSLLKEKTVSFAEKEKRLILMSTTLKEKWHSIKEKIEKHRVFFAEDQRALSAMREAIQRESSLMREQRNLIEEIRSRQSVLLREMDPLQKEKIIQLVEKKAEMQSLETEIRRLEEQFLINRDVPADVTFSREKMQRQLGALVDQREPSFMSAMQIGPMHENRNLEAEEARARLLVLQSEVDLLEILAEKEPIAIGRNNTTTRRDAANYLRSPLGEPLLSSEDKNEEFGIYHHSLHSIEESQGVDVKDEFLVEPNKLLQGLVSKMGFFLVEHNYRLQKLYEQFEQHNYDFCVRVRELSKNFVKIKRDFDDMGSLSISQRSYCWETTESSHNEEIRGRRAHLSELGELLSEIRTSSEDIYRIFLEIKRNKNQISFLEKNVEFRSFNREYQDILYDTLHYLKYAQKDLISSGDSKQSIEILEQYFCDYSENLAQLFHQTMGVCLAKVGVLENIVARGLSVSQRIIDEGARVLSADRDHNFYDLVIFLDETLKKYRDSVHIQKRNDEEFFLKTKTGFMAWWDDVTHSFLNDHIKETQAFLEYEKTLTSALAPKNVYMKIKLDRDSADIFANLGCVVSYKTWPIREHYFLQARREVATNVHFDFPKDCIVKSNCHMNSNTSSVLSMPLSMKKVLEDYCEVHPDHNAATQNDIIDARALAAYFENAVFNPDY